MRAGLRTGLRAESAEVPEESQPGGMLTLASSLMDWLAATTVDHPASVAIALALEEYACCAESPKVVARLRRGVDANKVQAVFRECQRERADELADQAGVAVQSASAGAAAVAGAQLVIEWQPVRYQSGDFYCALDTSDEAEYRFELRTALASLEEDFATLGQRRLEHRVAEIAAEFPDVRDELEEILWSSQN